MARHEVNRFGEMEVFVQVIEAGGFSAAARQARITPSAVSKLIGRLETRLRTRLFNRSTRQLQLTPEGCVFYESSKRILADLNEAEQVASTGETAVGRVRVNTSASYFNHILAPILPAFLELYPGITLDIVQTDAVIDLLAERTDVAIRTGPLKSSNLVARKLGKTALTVVAAPSYLARYGEPKQISELEQHNCLGFSYARSTTGWAFREKGETVSVPAMGNITTSDGESLRQLALTGTGLARLAAFTVRADIAAGRLVPILTDHDNGDSEAFYAVYLGEGGPLPARVRSLLNFLSESGKVH